MNSELFSAVILVIFLFAGDSLLKIMHLTNPALEIAGGIILFLIAIGMIFPSHTMPDANTESQTNEPFIVPLAIPMIAGPSVLATVLIASRELGQTGIWIAAIILASIINTFLLLSSSWFGKIFGKQGMEALSRLMGLILTTIAVQMLISGIQVAFFQPVIPSP